jgi:elongin-A
MFEPRMRLPMPAVHTSRHRIQSVVSESTSLSPPTLGTRVIVKPVPLRQRPTVSPALSQEAKPIAHNGPFTPGSQPLEPTPQQKQPSLSAKKEPTCSLFMPKHRAHSQLTSRLVPSRASTTK